jgi:predicted nucleic acid-binding protein
LIAVVDTSVFVELVAVDPEAQGHGLLDRIAVITPHVPDIVDVEFHHALRGLAIGGRISDTRARLARQLFGDIPKVRFPTHLLSDRIWALRHNLGAYDACFLALAEALEVY